MANSLPPLIDYEILTRAYDHELHRLVGWRGASEPAIDNSDRDNLPEIGSKSPAPNKFHLTPNRVLELLQWQLGVPFPLKEDQSRLSLSPFEMSHARVAGYDIRRRFWLMHAGPGEPSVAMWFERVGPLVIDALHDRGIDLVRVDKPLTRPPQPGAVDLAGKVTLRDMLRLIYHSHGVIAALNFSVHLAAGLGRPCLVLAGSQSKAAALFPQHHFFSCNRETDVKTPDSSTLLRCCTEGATNRLCQSKCQKLGPSLADVIAAVDASRMSSRPSPDSFGIQFETGYFDLTERFA
jgi:hypothetical protein